MPASPRPVPRHLVCVVAARPNLMKMAPLMVALSRLDPPVRVSLIHTGQHYDPAMDAQHYAALGLPPPLLNLGVGSGSHAAQSAEVMLRFEPVLEQLQPAAVLVVGDVNSTLACALVAAKCGVPVMHVEAGLRSGDRSMPEEINRVLTDQLAELLFTTEPSGLPNLLREGIDAERIDYVGNVMIDSLHACLPAAVPAQVTLDAAGLAGPEAGSGYAVLTLHRPSNVDQPERLHGLIEAMLCLSRTLPLILPLHPRTAQRIRQCGLGPTLSRSRIYCLPPQGYLEMLGLLKDARMVLTDSGGVQEETTALGVPCLTLRDNTERPVTVSEGSNTLAGHDPHTILALAGEILAGKGKAGRIPHYWDGRAAPRVAARIDQWLAGARPR